MAGHVRCDQGGNVKARGFHFPLTDRHMRHTCALLRRHLGSGWKNFSGLIFHIPVSCRGRVSPRHLSEPVRAHLARACHFLKHHFATRMGRIQPLKRFPVSFLSPPLVSVWPAHICCKRSRPAQLKVRGKSSNEHLRWTFITVVLTDKCPLGWCLFFNYTNKVARNYQSLSGRNVNCSQTVWPSRWIQVRCLPATQLVTRIK